MPDKVRFKDDQRGATAALVAVMFTALLGFSALGVDVGLYYLAYRLNQNAADAAAWSAAMEIFQQTDAIVNSRYPSPNNDNLHVLSACAAWLNGFNNAHVTSNNCGSPVAGTFTLNRPPSVGAYTTDNNAVEIILTQAQNSLLSAFVGNGATTIKTRAVGYAVPKVIPICLLALNTGASQTDIVFSGSSSFTATDSDLNPTCFVGTSSNYTSSILISGGGCSATNHRLVASLVETPKGKSGIDDGGVDSCLGPNNTYITGTPANPLTPQNLPGDNGTANPAILSGTCIAQPSSGNPLPNTCYNALTFSNSVTYNLSAGTYYSKGGITIQGGASVTGNGVTFVVGGSSQFKIQSGTAPKPIVNLTAPTSGTYANLVIYQVPSNTSTVDFGGCTGTCTFNGAIYAKKGVVSFKGSASSSCATIIADTFSFTGSSSINLSQSDFSGCPFTVQHGFQTAKLVE